MIPICASVVDLICLYEAHNSIPMFSSKSEIGENDDCQIVLGMGGQLQINCDNHHAITTQLFVSDLKINGLILFYDSW